jgi:hypothetical protein
VKVTRSDPEGAGVQGERQKQFAENMAAVSAADSVAHGSDDTREQLQDDDGGYEYEDDFEVS